MLKIIYRFIAALFTWLIILGIWDYFDAHTNNQIIQKLIINIIPENYNYQNYDWLSLGFILIPTILIMYLKKIALKYNYFQIYFYSLLVWILSLSIWDSIYGIEGGLIVWNKLINIFSEQSNIEIIKLIQFLLLPPVLILIYFSNVFDKLFGITNSKKIKTKTSKAGILGAVLGAAAYSKATHANKTPAAISRDTSKVKVISVVPRGNKWIVHYEWDYHGDGSNWRKDKYEVESTSSVGFNVGPTIVDLDWN